MRDASRKCPQRLQLLRFAQLRFKRRSGLFCLLALGDVGQRNAYAGPARSGFLQHAVQLCLKRRAVTTLQFEFLSVASIASLHIEEVLSKAFLIFRNHQGGEAALQQLLALPPQQRGAGEVDLLDHAFGAEGDIADRSEIIKIDIAVT